MNKGRGKLPGLFLPPPLGDMRGRPPRVVSPLSTENHKKGVLPSPDISGLYVRYRTIQIWRVKKDRGYSSGPLYFPGEAGHFGTVNV